MNEDDLEAVEIGIDAWVKFYKLLVPSETDGQRVERLADLLAFSSMDRDVMAAFLATSIHMLADADD